MPDNHYHLLIETPEANASRALQWLGGCLKKTGNQSHWHYNTMNQNPVICVCYHAKHQFGGCGPAPAEVL